MNMIKERLSWYRDYPLEVTIETTGRCNARCVFCPHGELERRNDYMNDEMFTKIINQLKEIPASHNFYISPFKVNEFLMDRQIFQRIDQITAALPNARIRIFSNFNMATKEDVKRIGLIKNLSDIDISLNSLDADEYKTLMGLELEKTKENAFYLLEYMRKIGIDMQEKKVVFSRVAQSPATDDAYLRAFMEQFADYLDIAQPRVILRQEWLDFMPSETPLNQNKPCMRWADVNICCNGVVAFCCQDGRGAYPLGNIMENTVLEIYNKPSYRRLRVECPDKADVTPCRFCSQ